MFQGRPKSGYPVHYPGALAGEIFFNPSTKSVLKSFHANFNADIVTCRARGQRVLMTVGGAGEQIDVTDLNSAIRFIDDVIEINTQLGGTNPTPAFDGIDWNSYEGAAASGRWVTYVCLALKAYFGADFLMTSPPACHNYNGQAALDRAVLAEMHAGGTYSGVYGTYTGTALDWFCPQYYDGDGNNSETFVCGTDAGSLAWYGSSVAINLNNGNTTTPVAIPSSKIGIGFGVSTLPYYWTTAGCVSCYIKAVGPPNARNPRGGFNFSANNNPTGTFASEVAPTILGSAGGGTLATVKRINGILVASTKRINGILIAAVKSWNGKQ
jgi:hypothetical protein